MTRQESKEELSALERYQIILAKKNLCLTQDDPLFPIILLHEAFLDDCETLLDKRDEKLKGFLDRAGDVLAQQLEKAFLELKEKEVLSDLVKSAVSTAEIKKTLEQGSNYLIKTRKTIFFMLLATWFVAVPANLVMFLILSQ